MSEIEAAAADSLGSFFRRKPRHALPLGSPCPNCATALEGPFCHACGQRAEDYHRSIVKLGVEAIEGFFELDGRLFRTLPRLVRDPAGLTRDYLEGHRAPQIPPFRLFLVVVVLVFFAGSLGPKGHTDVTQHGAAVSQARKEAAADMAREGIHVDETTVTASGQDVSSSAAGRWLTERGRAIAQNQDAFTNSLETWGHRLAILALPMSAAILGLLFVFRRQFYIFDHLIFSMHSLAFQGLLLTTILVLAQLTHWQVWWLLILVAPAHLFAHMRGVYGRGVITTLLRMFLLFVASCVGATLIMVMVFFLGLMDMGGRTTSQPVAKPGGTSAPAASPPASSPPASSPPASSPPAAAAKPIPAKTPARP